MATQRLTEETECGYCYSRGEFLTDPRELPCHHVYCLPCMEGHYSEHGNLTCSICKEVCLTEDLDSLPKVEAERHVTRVTCEGYKCQGQTAHTHCIECGHNLCITHLQSHKAHYGDSHKEVPIDVFEANPERFGKPVCEHHGEVLDRACKKCDKLICVECDMDGKDCTGLDTHQFKSLQSLREEVNCFLKDKLQSVEDKIEELVKLDKDVWKDLDTEEEKCDEMVEEIKRVRDEQIKLIREESEELIKKVDDHQVKVTNQVEEFYNKLVDKKDKMEKLKLETCRLLRDGHVTEKIRQKERITNELNKHVEEVLENCQLTVLPALLKIESDGEVGLNLRLVQTPSSLTFISKHETAGWCFSANHRQDGDILIGANNGVHLLSRDGKELTKYNTDDITVTRVIEYHQNNIYILHRAGNICKADMCLPEDMKRRQELLQFKRTENRAATMAVSDRYLVVNNPDTEQLIIYDFITKQTKTVLPPVYSVGLHFLPDGQLLAIGDGKLIKYRIENGKLSIVWTCEGLVNGYWVCADSDGLIYVSTLSKQTVYIISPQGVRVNTLTYDQLPAAAGCISVRDGVLAVPGWEDKMLHLFKINRGDNSTDE